MAPDTTVVSESVSGRPEVMASVDDDGTTRRYVIADLSRDEAWISMRVAQSASLLSWQ